MLTPSVTVLWLKISARGRYHHVASKFPLTFRPWTISSSWWVSSDGQSLPIFSWFPAQLLNRGTFRCLLPSCEPPLSLHCWTGMSWYVVAFLSEASSQPSSHSTVTSIRIILFTSSTVIWPHQASGMSGQSEESVVSHPGPPSSPMIVLPAGGSSWSSWRRVASPPPWWTGYMRLVSHGSGSSSVSPAPRWGPCCDAIYIFPV